MKNSIITLSALVLIFAVGSISACSSDDALDDCLKDCGELEGFTADSPCGADGWLYHNQCEMDCHGVAPAEDKWLCASELSDECDAAHAGLASYYITRCGTLKIEWCNDSRKWESNADGECMSGEPVECFADCPACPEDTGEFVCGKKGVLYCNECVMGCLEDQAAADAASCTALAQPAGFCEEGVDTFATRDESSKDYGCNSCECQGGLWHCSFWACPGTGEIAE